MVSQMDKIDNVFRELSSDMQSPFFACFNYFCEQKGISSDEFKINSHMYERDFLGLWNEHCILLSGDDERYGHLNCSESD